MSFKRTEYPEFSWSLSREKALNECERGYFYNYYVSHNGWERNASEEARLAYTLKKLTGKHMLKGALIHETIKSIIEECREKDMGTRNIEKITNEALFETYGGIDEIVYFNKKYGPFWKRNNIDGFKDNMLMEYYYEEDLSDDEILILKDEAYQAVHKAIYTKSFLELISPYSEILELDGVEGNNFPSFIIGETRVYAKADAIYKDKNGKYTIVDWKTGSQSDDDIIQAYIYAKYCMDMYQVKIEDIDSKIEYLKTGSSIDVFVGETLMFGVSEIMEAGIEKMKGYLEDEEANRPKSINAFCKTNDSYKCKKCKFRNICDK